MNNQVKSAARVLELLEWLSGQTTPVKLNQVTGSLDLPKSSAFGLLSTLVSRGYVVKTADDRYELVDAFRQGFGWVGGFESILRPVALPIIEALRDRINETVFVCVRTAQQDARLVCKAVSTQHIRYDTSDDSVLPGYATVMGRVLLAYQDPQIVDDYFTKTELKPFSPTTPTTEEAVRAELDQIRRDGYGVIIDQYAQGGAGIAAPIRGQNGDVVAVVDLATVTSRFEIQRDRMRAAVLECAAEISARLGYRDIASGLDETSTPEGVA
ncbi:IclR family transcriptional regulator [Sulfitobacter sp. HNIBRBA3233]|uniref:IclR family transcriptional regulator n=1 Tax=Sulfitobacter marinivivus TaxID=3158558 RepID=UPI0032DF3FA9